MLSKSSTFERLLNCILCTTYVVLREHSQTTLGRCQWYTDFPRHISLLNVVRGGQEVNNGQNLVNIGTIHLRRQHVLGGKGYPHVPMVKRSHYIRIKNPFHKHFAGMPMVGGWGSKIVKICRRLKWMVPKEALRVKQGVGLF